MNVVLTTHLVCAAAFGILGLLLLAGRERSRSATALAMACGAMAVWALAAALTWPAQVMVLALVETVRDAAWLYFLRTLLLPSEGPMPRWARTLVASSFAVVVLAFTLDLAFLVLAPDAPMLLQPQIVARVAIAVLGLSLIENYYRNVQEDDRWSTVPLVIAIGGIFSFELFFYVDAQLSRKLDAALVAARALADVLSVPLLLLAMVRSRNLRTDLRVSHKAAFHAVTLVSSGAFLMAAAVVGMLFRRYGGQWGVLLQVTSLFGSALVLATVLSSETARSQIRMAVLRNFFSYRYDYRVEWLRTIEALSSGGAARNLPERLIRVLADIVNSPGGVLFQLRDTAYLPTAFWNAQVASEAREPAESEFIAAFRGGRWIQDLAGPLAPAAPRPAWLSGIEDFWLAVPLPRQGELMGFVLLEKPRAAVHPDWEVFDLLRTVAGQTASYLFEQQAERALADAQLLQEYGKRFAFVVHDIKNLSSQLGLILSNARRHGDNPEFQADVLRTVENSVGRMNKLISQLRIAGTTETPPAVPGAADAAAIVRELAASHSHSGRVEIGAAAGARVLMDAEQLRSVLAHLIDNAVEASGAEGRVRVSLGDDGEHVTIDITDEGPGMDVSFVRDELFRPFRSTKDTGLGIGAFQTRELIRAAGGQLDVITKPGAGTTMRIVLGSAGPVRVFPAA
jgi:putative PEP-CTERM system histidine kinase